MTMKKIEILKRSDLEYREGASDKLYSIWVQQAADGCLVQAVFGRRGSAQQRADKTSFPVPEADAMRIFTKTVAEKIAKGYTPVAGNGSPVQYAPPVPVKSDAFIPPMLLNEIDEDMAQFLIADDGWILQQKFDGVRCQLHRAGSQVLSFSRTGKPLTITSALRDALLAQPKSYGDFIVDGELVGHVFHAFDLLKAAGQDFRDKPCEDRYRFACGLSFNDMRMVASFYTPFKKQSAYTRLRSSGAEGVVFKRKSAKYVSGRPNAGGDALKRKFVATCTVRVESHNTKRSVNMALSDGTLVGSVTIPPNKDVPKVGALIECRYLYLMRGGSLVQPVYLGVREDVDGADKAGQLQYKAG